MSHVFVATNIFCRDKKFCRQNRQKFCRDETTFVATKDVFCRNKHMFVATNTCLSRQKGYLWQLSPMIPLFGAARYGVSKREKAWFGKPWVTGGNSVSLFNAALTSVTCTLCILVGWGRGGWIEVEQCIPKGVEATVKASS